MEEQQNPGEDPKSYVLRNASLKANEVFSRPDLPDSAQCLLAADTIVVQAGSVLEKPKDDQDAICMLQNLSDSHHEVITGYCLMGLGRQHGVFFKEAVTTSVHFKALTQEEIEAYVASGEPRDKAGAYGIQGLAGYMVSKIEGSYSNVVGLPLMEVVTALQTTFGYALTVRSGLA